MLCTFVDVPAVVVFPVATSKHVYFVPFPGQSWESKLGVKAGSVVFYVESYSLGGRGLCVRVVHIGALFLGGGGEEVVALFCA